MADALNPKTAPLVVVEWSDITDTPNWNEDIEVDFYQFHSAGWLIENSNQRIVLSRSYDWSENKWREFVVFPKAAPEIRVIVPAEPKPAPKGTRKR